jgi:uncharacterized protein (TIGR02270 family)
MIVPAVLQQHADDATMLASARLALVEAPYPGLNRLDRFDRRLAANLDGLRLSGEEGWAHSEAALETPSPGAVFAVSVRALEARDDARLARAFALAQAAPGTIGGVLGALEWVERAQLQGTVASLLRDRDGFRRMVAVAACAMHRVDPGIVSRDYLQDTDCQVRARAFWAAGELGLSELVSSCAEASRRDGDPESQFWAAWSAVLLGDRRLAVDALTRRGLSPGPHRARAFRLALQAMGIAASRGILKGLAVEAQQLRWLIQGSGISGDPVYVPWLLKRMSDQKTARLAGEAFSTIVGVNLGQASLDRPAPKNFESGPSDDPDDPDVDMDPDDGLSWPHLERIAKWWAANISGAAGLRPP